MKTHNRKHLFKKIIFIPFGVAAILAIISYVVMQLWNSLLPGILHVGPINFWQAMGIFILSKILFGFGGPRGGGSPWMRKKRMMQERFASMTDEEKARFKEQWKDRCNWGRRGTGRPGRDFKEPMEQAPQA